MILAHPQLSEVLELSGAWVTTVVVEHPQFFRTLLCDLYAQLQGEPGQLILSDRGTVLPIHRHVELVDNCLQLDLNRKTLLSKIAAAIERAAVSESFFMKTSAMLSQLEAYMDEIAFSLPGDIVCEKCSVSGLIKALGIRLRDTYEDPLEQLLDFMELIREFDREKLFIIVGLRSYFSDDAVAQFFKTVVGHGYHVLLLDGVDREKIPLERRLTIDKDLCEF